VQIYRVTREVRSVRRMPRQIQGDQESGTDKLRVALVLLFREHSRVG
jgi:hypothetical protein